MGGCLHGRICGRDQSGRSCYQFGSALRIPIPVATSVRTERTRALAEAPFCSSLPKGVTVTVAPDVPLFVSLESNRHFCLETPAGRAAVPLRYLLCVSPDVAAAHRLVGSRLVGQARALPDMALLG